MTVHFRDGMTAGDIAGRFHVAWPTISRHLKVLEDAGLTSQQLALQITGAVARRSSAEAREGAPVE